MPAENEERGLVMDFSRRAILVTGAMSLWSTEAVPQEITGATIMYGTPPTGGPYFFGDFSFYAGKAHNPASFGNFNVEVTKDIHPEQKVERGPCGNQ